MSIKAWNEEQESELIALYTEQEIKDVHKLADHFDKGYRSVISKLVQLKIYDKPDNGNSDKTMTVKTILRELEDILEFEIEGTNLNKKENLTKLIIALRKKINKE